MSTPFDLPDPDEVERDVLYEQAKDSLQKGHYAEALEDLKELLKRDPDNLAARDLLEQARVQARYEEGKTALTDGDFAQAIRCFEEVQSLSPDFRDTAALLNQAKREIRSNKNRRIMMVAGGILALGLVVCGLVTIFRSILPPLISSAAPTMKVTVITDTPLPASMMPLSTFTPVPPVPSPTFTPGNPVTPTSLPTPTDSCTASATPTEEAVPSPPTLESTVEVVTLEPSPTDTFESSPAPTLTPLPTDTPVSAEPTASPLSGKIAVPVFSNGMYDIYIARADEDWTLQLLFERASQPAFSGDGQGFAFHSWDDPDLGKQIIYLENVLDSANFRKMTNFIEDAHPSINKNDKSIIFHSRQEDRERNPILIKMGTHAGSTPVKLREGANPDWLYDNRIVFYNSFPEPGLYLTDQDGSDISAQLILPAAGRVVPAAAPDDDRIAVSLKVGDRWQIFTFSAELGQDDLTQLTFTDKGDNFLPTWSPNGNAIAFASNRENNWAVWVMNADGANLTKLFDLPGSVDGIISSPNVEKDLSFGWSEEKMSWGP